MSDYGGGSLVFRLRATSHLVTSSAASTGEVQSPVGVNVVCICEQLNRCCVLCICILQSGHCGDVCVVGSTLCRYVCKNGDLLALS